MNIETVNELIQSLESAGELSIKERKYLDLAKAYLQLAAENVALKGMHHYSGLSPKYSRDAMLDMKRPFIDELIYSAEFYSVCGHISASLNRAISAVHGDYSWLPETPATDAYLAGIKADGVEEFAKHCDDSIGFVEPEDEEPRLHIKEQPAPVVPPMQHWEELCRQYPDMSIRDAIIRAAWWNHCRAAMLQAGNSPVIPDGYVMVPKEPTDEMLAASYMFAHVDATRESWLAMLAAAPQEVKGE